MQCLGKNNKKNLKKKVFLLIFFCRTAKMCCKFSFIFKYITKTSCAEHSCLYPGEKPPPQNQQIYWLDGDHWYPFDCPRFVLLSLGLLADISFGISSVLLVYNVSLK